MLIVIPSDFTNWTDALAADTTLALEDGDYTSWGQLITFPNAVFSITANSGRPLIRNFNILAATDGLLEGVQIEDYGSNIQNSTNVTIRDVRIIDIGRAAFNGVPGAFYGTGIDIKDTDFSVIENCYFEQTDYRYTKDNAAILVRTGLQKAEADGIIIRNNEFKNWNDSIQPTWDDSNFTGSLPNLLIEGNTMYITSEFYTPEGKAYAENALDIKRGGTAGNPMVVRDNFMYGYRRTDNTQPNGPSGSSGQAITVQIRAQYVDIVSNVIQNCTAGITIRSSIATNGGPTDNIVITDNYFNTMILRDDTDDSGKGIADFADEGVDTVICRNIFENTPIPIYSESSSICDDNTIITDENKEMTYTINYTVTDNACTSTDSITLSSAKFDAFLAAQPSPDHTLDLIITLCDGTEYTKAIEVADITVVAGDNDTVDLEPDDLSMTTTITDGVYSIELRKTTTATNATESEYSCIFVDCNVGCAIIDHVSANLETPIVGYYQLLQRLNVCDSCSCDAACVLYCEIQSAITDPTISHGCGCS